MRKVLAAFAAVFCFGFLSSGAPPDSSSAKEWRFYGGDPGGTRFSSLDQINRCNVTRLQPAWTYRTGELELGLGDLQARQKPAFECTPLVVDGVLYLTTPSSRVIALDATTGKEIWKFDPQAGRPKRRFLQHRGVSYWEGPPVDGNQTEKRILYGTLDARLYSLDAATGQPCAEFGEGGYIDLRKGAADKWPDGMYTVTSPPAIFKNLVITGARVPEGPGHGPSGVVRAFDIRSGKMVWKFYAVPQAGEVGNETWEGESWKDRTGGNVWSVISVDAERGMVFLPIGAAGYDFYGGDRKGQNLFANSIVALNAETGKLLWYFQTVHHDVWDYDLAAQPVLVTVRRDGREIPAVAQITKMGLLFVLDRVTGKPLFPVEERPVPQSDVPGEETWPTQPFPVKPPGLSRQSVSASDLNTLTPELKKFCGEFFDSISKGGLYTPTGLELTLMAPGTLGGGNWSGASFDPASGYLFVNVNEIPMIGYMKPQAENSPVRYRRASQWGEYARFWTEEGMPCIAPPWGTFNAIDLNTGEITWRVPLGVVDELQAKGIPKTGALNLGGSIVTAGGLVFIGGANDGRFRAFDARTGEEVWVTKLEASGHATPITYLGKDGRQYVVIAAGGGGYFSDEVSDVMVGFSLAGE